MDLKECFDKGLIKKVSPNFALVRSLVEMANIKEQTVKNAKIDSVNISAYVALAYDALREVLEAICISRGFKVLSHICIGELLKTLLEDFDHMTFDRLRYIRNSINYYGVKVELNEGLEFINHIFRMKKSLITKYLKC